jgi:hypothetical protein
MTSAPPCESENRRLLAARNLPAGHADAQGGVVRPRLRQQMPYRRGARCARSAACNSLVACVKRDLIAAWLPEHFRSESP